MVNPVQLIDWPTRPAWQADGACVGTDPSLWFPAPGEVQKVAQAKRICATCTVRERCLDYAMTFGPRGLAGIWGGMSERQRVTLRRTRMQ